MKKRHLIKVHIEFANVVNGNLDNRDQFHADRDIEILMSADDVPKNKYRLFIDNLMPADFDFSKQKVVIYKIYA